jgi:hypothetical protein
MASGMIFTSIVAFITCLATLATGLFFRRNKKSGDKLLSAYSFFWLNISLVWFFVALRHFFGWLGFPNLDRLSFIIVMIFIFFSGIPVSYYLGLKIFKKLSVARFFSGVLSAGVFLGLVTILADGVVEGEVSYFATKFRPAESTFTIFVFFIIPLMMVSFFDSLLRLWRWIKKREKFHELVYSLALFLYFLLGVFDVRGLIVDWKLVIFRLVFSLISLSVLLAFYFQTSRWEDYIEEG